MPGKTAGGWWSRRLLVVVALPVLAGILLAGVSVFRGWLHHHAGFDAEGKPLTLPNTAPELKEPPATKSRPVIAAADAYRHIVDDLRRRDPETRSRFRYLSLLHRHNEPTCTAAELEADRQAVRELTALLGKGQSTQVVFIDPEQLLLRIGLEDFAWDSDADWRKLVTHYRYGLGAGGPEPLAKLRQQVEQFTGDSIPVVRADWFVVALTRPPLADPAGLFKTPLKDLPEAIRTHNRQYAAQTLDRAACARELGLDDEKTLADLIRSHDNLQQEFGLAPLLRGERIRREWWESDRNYVSPYQELAKRLKLGQPVGVQ